MDLWICQFPEAVLPEFALDIRLDLSLALELVPVTGIFVAKKPLRILVCLPPVATLDVVAFFLAAELLLLPLLFVAVAPPLTVFAKVGLVSRGGTLITFFPVG